MMMARVQATLAAFAAFSLAVSLHVTPATAQTAPAQPKAAPEASKKTAAPKKKAAPAEAKDAASAQKQLDSAQKSLDAGKPEVAINQANAIMSLSGIDARSMARALVIRGMSFKKQGKPAQAMADLQSALYIKGGLNDAERTAAAAARSEAYREAGLPEPAAIGAPRPTAPTASRVQTASTARADEPKSSPAPAPASSGGNFFSSLFGGGSGPQAAAQPQAAPAPAPAAVAPAPEPAPSKAATKTPPARATVAQAAPGAIASPPAAAPATPAPTKAAAAGRFRMQLGPVRTQSEAKSVSDRVRKDYAAAVTGRSVTIEETVFGNMGTFYIVVVGPYAEAAEPKEHCATLRGAKISDCQVLAP
jgi:hypothetical protein